SPALTNASSASNPGDRPGPVALLCKLTGEPKIAATMRFGAVDAGPAVSAVPAGRAGAAQPARTHTSSARVDVDRLITESRRPPPSRPHGAERVPVARPARRQ